MNASLIRWALVVIFVILGGYLLLVHADPWPANHEAIGLGKLHLVHSAIGLVLLVGAGYLWYSGRGKSASHSAQ